MRKSNMYKEIKVSSLAGDITKQACYHYGAVSLEETIIKMAQSFVGSNNIPLLTEDGQFGSRFLGGKDNASSRYINTGLRRISKVLFPEDDDPLLQYVFDEGKYYEPKNYIPIIPLILINGCSGIGTGWSSDIPMFNPLDLVKWVREWLNDQEPTMSLIPWYRGFTGSISVTGNKWTSKGVIKQVTKNSYLITELPIEEWTTEFTAALRDNPKVTEVVSQSTDNTVSLLVTVKRGYDFLADMNKKSTPKQKALIKTYSLNNMHVLINGLPQKMNTPNDILSLFCPKRLELYGERKKLLIGTLTEERMIAENKRRFVEEVRSGKLDIRQDEDSLVKVMEKSKYHKVENKYNYLLSLPVRSLTEKKALDLEKEVASLCERVKDLENKTNKQMWLDDLSLFEKEYEDFLKSLEI
jgi:DNA topoisomerase II